MSNGINRVILLGRLGNDPEVRYSASGSAVATISVATSKSWKDKTTGQKQERTEWSRVIFFGKLAEIVGQYLKKGSQVYVEGSLRTSKYTDKQGIERYSTDINATTMQMLGGGNGGGEYDQRPQQGGYNQPNKGGYNQPQNSGRPADNLSDSDFDKFEDTVPF